jgi:hypothetical protein
MANAITQSFDPQDIELIVGGVPFEVFGSESVVTVTRNEDVNTFQVGVLGDVTNNYSRNRTGQLTVVTKAQSLEDNFMDQLASLTGFSGIPVVLRIASANKILTSGASYMSQADLAAGNQVDDRGHILNLANASFAAIDNANSLIDQIETISI